MQRWASLGAWAQPDPCAPPSGKCSVGGAHCTGNCTGSPCGDGGTCVLSRDGYGKEYGPDGKGGCILDTDPSDGIGRFPYRHGMEANRGSYNEKKWVDAMWAKYAPAPRVL